MASSMSFLSLGSGKVALNTWWLHYSCSIPCNHKVSLKGFQMEHKDMIHATYRLKIQSVIGIKDISPKRQVSI
jgi:hypothetical protein